MNAEITKKLNKLYQTGKYIQPSVQDVVSQLQTESDQKYSNLPEREILVYLSILIQELGNVVLSGDCWYLAESAAINRCLKLGMKQEYILSIKDTVSNNRKRSTETNPLASMF
jgi:hypothetical protein